jgi:hypothetical protein
MLTSLEMNQEDIESQDYDFAETWSGIFGEREKAIARRTDLETELIEVRNKIAHLDQILDHMGPLAGLSSGDYDFLKLGLTDAVRGVVSGSWERMSAQEIRNALTEKGYDLSSLTAPMQSIYKILSRLADDSKQIEREKEDGRVYYKWKRTRGPITDEDIPF